jgi:hypothetical protein
MVLLVPFAWVPLQSQVMLQDPSRTWPIDSVLSRFDRHIRAHLANSPGFDAVFRILRLPASYAARKDSLLEGLELLALTSDNREVREVAAERIAEAGELGRNVPPVPGIWPRLARIYRSNTAWLVRSAILDHSPMLAERGAALAFLRSVAAEEDTTTPSVVEGYFGYGDLRIWALDRIAEMGEDGRAVLQAMHRSGEVRSPQARWTLDAMAQRGFPVRELRRRSP